MRDDHAPERGGCVEDRGNAACDLGLRIGEKREGERGVEQGEKKERAPESGAARSHAAGGGHETEHQQRRGAKAGEDESEGRNLARSEEHTSELQALMRISYAVFCLKKKNKKKKAKTHR